MQWKRFKALLGRVRRKPQQAEESKKESPFTEFLDKCLLDQSNNLSEYNGVWNRDRLFNDDVRILFFLARTNTNGDKTAYAFTAYEQCECVVEISKIKPITPQLNMTLVTASLTNIANPDVDPDVLSLGITVKLMTIPHTEGPSLVSMAYVKRVLDTDFDSWVSLYKTGSYTLFSKEPI